MVNVHCVRMVVHAPVSRLCTFLNLCLVYALCWPTLRCDLRYKLVLADGQVLDASIPNLHRYMDGRDTHTAVNIACTVGPGSSCLGLQACGAVSCPQ